MVNETIVKHLRKQKKIEELQMVRDKSSQRRRLEKSLNTVKLQIQKHDSW